MPIILLLSTIIILTQSSLFGAAAAKKQKTPNQAELAQMLDAGDFTGKESDEGYVGEIDSESDPEKEGFEEVFCQQPPAATMRQLIATGIDTTFFIGLRKFCCRRQAIQIIYHTMHKSNPDHTLAYLQSRKEFHPNYYLDVAISEAKKEGDLAFIASLETLINRAIELKLEFSQENKAWLYKTKQEIKKANLKETKRLVEKLSKQRIEENNILRMLRLDTPESLQQALPEASDDESNMPQALLAKIVSAP